MLGRIVNKWKSSDFKGKMRLLYVFLGFPAFLMHELSHLIVLFLTCSYFTVDKFILFDYDENEDGEKTFVYYDLSLSSTAKGFAEFLIAIAPDIVYVGLLVFFVYLMLFISFKCYVIGFSVLIYMIIYKSLMSCSKQDVETYRNSLK
jgi:hypothetical protein